MHRLLKRKRKGRDLSPSTGVCNSVVIVDMDLDNPSTFHSVTVIDANWEEVSHDTSLVSQMNMVNHDGISTQEQIQEMLPAVHQQTAFMNSPIPVSTMSGDTPMRVVAATVQPTIKLHSGATRKNPIVDVSDTEVRELLGVIDGDIEEMIKAAIQNYGASRS